jgi:hypothetical protein
MAHYAFLDQDNKTVTDVIVGIDETELIEGLDPETWYGNFRGRVCKRTSYNGNIRKNFASVGFTYDSERDAFIAPKPYGKWILDEATCQWTAPVDYPTDGLSYLWNNNQGQWELITAEKPDEALEG